MAWCGRRFCRLHKAQKAPMTPRGIRNHNPGNIGRNATVWQGKAYDQLGNAGFVFGFIPDGKDKSSCAESIADALGYPAPWRYSPAILHQQLQIA